MYICVYICTYVLIHTYPYIGMDICSVPLKVSDTVALDSDVSKMNAGRKEMQGIKTVLF